MVPLIHKVTSSTTTTSPPTHPPPTHPPPAPSTPSTPSTPAPPHKEGSDSGQLLIPTGEQVMNGTLLDSSTLGRREFSGIWFYNCYTKAFCFPLLSMPSLSSHLFTPSLLSFPYLPSLPLPPFSSFPSLPPSSLPPLLPFSPIPSLLSLLSLLPLPPSSPLSPLPPLPPILLPPSPCITDAEPSGSLSKLNPANLTSWTPDDVCQWLAEQGLGPFVPVFRENAVDGECLFTLDHNLLKTEMGILPLGHRSRILKRVQALKDSIHPGLT